MEVPEIDRAVAGLLAGRRAADLESQTLDFKLAAGPLKSVFVRVANAAVCFANADGGHIVLGVDDKSAWSGASTAVRPRDLSKLEFGRLRSLLVAAGRDHLSDLDDLALLRALRLLAADQTVTNAGLLLLADDSVLREALPAHGYSYQYRPSAGSEATAHFRGCLPWLAAIESLMQAVDARQQVRPLNVSGGVQLQLSDYPRNAVRELVVNGLIHRSYETQGSVDIEHTPRKPRNYQPWLVGLGSDASEHPHSPVHTTKQVAHRGDHHSRYCGTNRPGCGSSLPGDAENRKTTAFL